MPEGNRINITIPTTVLRDALAAVQNARTLLAPYLHSLSDEDRQDIFKIGDKTVGFMDKVQTYLGTAPEFMPRTMEAAPVLADYQAFNDLAPLEAELRQLFAEVEDTKMLAGSDALIGAMPYYTSVADAARRGDDGARVIYDDLKARFPGRRRKAVPQ